MEIKNYREINKGCLKSAFTLVIPEWANLEIDCTFFEKSNDKYWVNYAPKEYITPDGQKKTHNQIRWPRAVSDRLNTAIRDKINSGHVVKRSEQQMSNHAAIKSDEEEVPF